MDFIWTDEQIEILISTYKQLPILYNRNLQSNDNEYWKATKAIVLIMKKSWTEIQKKFMSMKSYHKKIYTDYSVTKVKPRWRFYDAMSYLIEYYESAIDDHDSDEVISIPLLIMNNFATFLF